MKKLGLIVLFLVSVNAVFAVSDPIVDKIRERFEKMLRANEKNSALGRSESNNYLFTLDDPDTYQEIYKNGGSPVINPTGSEAIAIKERLALFNKSYADANMEFYFFTGSIFLDADRTKAQANVDWKTIKDAFYKKVPGEVGNKYETLEKTREELVNDVVQEISMAAAANGKKVIIQFAISTAIGRKINDQVGYDFVVTHGIELNGFSQKEKDELRTLGRSFQWGGERSVVHALNSIASYFGSSNLFQNYDALSKNTTALRKENWLKSVSSLEPLLKRKPGVFLIYDESKISLDGEVEWRIENVKRKLELLSKETKFRYYVYLHPIDFVVPEDSLTTYATDMLTHSGLGANDVLLCVPVYTTLVMYKKPASIVDYDFKMFALASGKDVKFDIQPTLSYTASVYANFVSVYKHIVKPSVLDISYLNFSGELINLKRRRIEAIGGFEDIYNYQLMVDNRLQDYLYLLKKYSNAENNLDTHKRLAKGEQRDVGFFEVLVTEAEEEIWKFEADAEGKDEGYSPVIHDLWESSLVNESENVGYKFSEWFRGNEFSKYRSDISKSPSPADEHFHLGRNEVDYQDNLNTIDNVSLMLAPFELDIAADLVGTLYAGYYHDWPNTAAYAVAVAIPAGLTVRVFMKGGKGYKFLKNAKAVLEYKAYSTVIPLIPFRIRTYLPTNVLISLKTEEAVGLINKIKSTNLSWQSVELLGKDLDESAQLLDLFKSKPELLDAWQVLNAQDMLRKNPANLEKLSKFMTETGMEKSKLISSLGNARDAQKWIDMKIPEGELNALYDGVKNDPPFDFTPWTKEHKAHRWNNYKKGCANGENTCADFKEWSNGYDGKIDLVASANKGVDDYLASLNWNCPGSTCREQTLDVTIEGVLKKRRLDIFDKANLRGKEFKEYYSGKVYRSEDILAEVMADKELLATGQLVDMEWVFKGCEPSGPLKELLESTPNPIKVIKLP